MLPRKAVKQPAVNQAGKQTDCLVIADTETRLAGLQPDLQSTMFCHLP
jgi:hypothetical protein